MTKDAVIGYSLEVIKKSIEEMESISRRLYGLAFACAELHGKLREAMEEDRWPR